METVTSRDGTQIAFERSGSGPPLVLVHGSTGNRMRWAAVQPALTRKFTIFAMDRRGSGDSGDAGAYSLEREYEDVVAVANAAGTGVNLLGHSFGALCAMEAALSIDELRRLVLYEPAFPVGGAPLYPPGLPERLHEIFATGDRDNFLATFFKDAVGVSDEQLAALRADPSWQMRIKSAHTALREMADGDYRFEADRFRDLRVPTLLLVGEESPAVLTAPSEALHAALPDNRIVRLAGQGHIAMTTAPDLFAEKVMDFLIE